jgi:hypothetical protein
MGVTCSGVCYFAGSEGQRDRRCVADVGELDNVRHAH